ncbi:MAG: hypothetical protein R3B13_00175 [Polyangiaceae bacterium]
MNALKAHVKNGQIVLDEPGELPQRVALDVLVPGADLRDQIDADERAALTSSIDEGLAAGDEFFSSRRNPGAWRRRERTVARATLHRSSGTGL